jgi:hypothetical protein
MVSKEQVNDLPNRLDHYKKRAEIVPSISVENFEVPAICKPYEMISIGVLLGFPIFKIQNLEDCVKDYHDLMAEKSHPLHCFNNPKQDAKYFPDPMRNLNYLNPARLWEGLIQFGILEKKESGYSYEESLTKNLQDMEAREGYKSGILQLEKKILESGGFEKISPSLLAQSIQTLAMLAKTKDGFIVFRKEVSYIIADILDGDGTADRAKEKNISKNDYIEKIPQTTKI